MTASARAAEELFDRDDAFPRLTDDLIAVLDAAGTRRTLDAGDVLYRAGDRDSEFFVLLSGLVAGIDAYGSPAERVLGLVRERRFGGELSSSARS